jgi:SAM-dependent methyltransferase
MNKWDEKAKNYARYSTRANSFEANVMETLKKLNIDFKDKKILDVGCGTGVYTLKIAQLAKSVVGIDFSEKMLEVLKEDAKKLNITNITTHHSTWDDFNLNNQIYDISICTMSPAVKTQEQLEKFHKSAKIKIYLGWAGVRDCTILDDLFVAHNTIYEPPNGAKRVKEWLHVNNINYKIKNFEELKIRVRSYEEALENYTWHLNVRGVNPKKEKIINIIKPLCDKEKNITEETINKMDLLVW